MIQLNLKFIFTFSVFFFCIYILKSSPVGGGCRWCRCPHFSSQGKGVLQPGGVLRKRNSSPASFWKPLCAMIGQPVDHLIRSYRIRSPKLLKLLHQEVTESYTPKHLPSSRSLHQPILHIFLVYRDSRVLLSCPRQFDSSDSSVSWLSQEKLTLRKFDMRNCSIYGSYRKKASGGNANFIWVIVVLMLFTGKKRYLLEEMALFGSVGLHLEVSFF